MVQTRKDNMDDLSHNASCSGAAVGPSSRATDLIIENRPNNTTKKEVQKSCMDLNVAYEALEQVRRANVDIEFGMSVPPCRCVPCLRENSTRQIGCTSNSGANRNAAGQSFRRLRQTLPRNKASHCLTCGTPVCPRHRCEAFRKENISICRDCSKFFSFDFIVESVMICDDSPSARKRLMGSMLDVYDRSLLILEFSSRYVDQIAEALENNTRRNDRIGLGSSATSFVSGLAGVAAAATIFTPVGPPLLIASILFGGGATAVSAGSETVNYHCEPNKMADRIIVLRDVVYSISRLVPSVGAAELHEVDSGDAMMRTASGGRSSSSMMPSRNWTRATANALKPLTAGALSAASVIMEAREMRTTVEKIRTGHPCEKAEALRAIREEMSTFPSTSLVSKECQKYFLLEKASPMN